MRYIYVLISLAAVLCVQAQTPATPPQTTKQISEGPGKMVGPIPPAVPEAPAEPSAASQLMLLQSKQIDHAKAEIERVTELVNAGALPRVKLVEAEEKLADAQDDLILSKTLYGDLQIDKLTDQMADEMVAAAQRRVDRQMKKVAQSQKLVADGVIANAEIQPQLDELNLRKVNLSLSHARAKLIGELAALAQYEKSMRDLSAATRVIPYTDYTFNSMVHYQGSGLFLSHKDLLTLEAVFRKRFDRDLPISADGQTATHNALGFDHRGRIDVAVNPSDPEGVWLCKYLESKGVSYYAFQRAIPGKATGAHIHIGPGSTKLHNAD